MAEIHIKRKVTVSAQLVNDYASRPSSPIDNSTATVSSAKLASLQPTSYAPIPLRPRAKLDAGATFASVRKPTGAASSGYCGPKISRSPRSPSPSLPQDASHGRYSPMVGSANHLNAYYPTLPRPRNVITTESLVISVDSDSSLMSSVSPHVRHGRMSSLSKVSPASMTRASSAISTTSSVISSSSGTEPHSDVSSMRVKAKVTNTAKDKLVFSSTPPSPCASPSMPRQSAAMPLGLGVPSAFRQRVDRTASVSSISTKDLPTVTMIDRTPPVSTIRLPCDRPSYGSPHRPHSPGSSLFVEGRVTGSQRDFGPAVVAPLSPPSSTVSFSSHSSGSHVSASSAFFSPGVASQNESPPSFLLENSNHRPVEANGCSVESDEERNVRAEAKSNRKIADLEITNKSLLAINLQLESQKNKHMNEIRELRRKLRESRLILPPRVYHELKSNGDRMFDDEEEIDEKEGEGDEKDREERMKNEIERLSTEDEQFARVYGMLENLLTAGRLALASNIKDSAASKVVAKVLNEEEARPWRDIQGASECQSMALDPDVDMALVDTDVKAM